MGILLSSANICLTGVPEGKTENGRKEERSYTFFKKEKMI